MLVFSLHPKRAESITLALVSTLTATPEVMTKAPPHPL